MITECSNHLHFRIIFTEIRCELGAKLLSLQSFLKEVEYDHQT
jgi:hypothetical protein